MNLIKKAFNKIYSSAYDRASIYYRFFMNLPKVRRLRKKEVINVIFVVTNVGMWKTELLYLRMKEHPRFNPMIHVLPSYGKDELQMLAEKYMREKGYEYISLKSDEPLQKYFHADIIFYMQPYMYIVHEIQEFYHNRNALFCFVTYGAHNFLTPLYNQIFHNIAWQNYFENYHCGEEFSKIMTNHGWNIQVTGLPMYDQFHKPISSYHYDWKIKSDKLKRIIYAPHFSIGDDSLLKYATFVENGEFMLEMAKKYNNEVQFIFKPHPYLKATLIKYWGKERTEAYYNSWDELSNGKTELGAYVDAFMTSDALIHDCSTFTNEYMFTGKPALFLVRDRQRNHNGDLSTYTSDAYDMHYKGYCHEDIEKFIQDVIDGIDPMAEGRKKYYDKYLKAIDGKMACDNIIDAILGNKNYSLRTCRKHMA